MDNVERIVREFGQAIAHAKAGMQLLDATCPFGVYSNTKLAIGFLQSAIDRLNDKTEESWKKSKS